MMPTGDEQATSEIPKSPRRAFALAFLVVASAAFLAIVPMFWFGVPSGHDFEFHMDSWMEVVSHWHQGIFYPRWAAMANFGYGEPRFVFYPPASWMLGAALGTVFPWAIVPGIYIWMVLTAAGCAMYVPARRWLPARDAIFAAAFYAVNPYHLVIVYWRSAFAELMVAVWLPLLLMWVLRLEEDEDGRKAMLWLAAVVAAAWLTNVPGGVMVNYSLVLLVCVVAVLRRSPRVLLYGAMACVLGLGLAGFYILPAMAEQKWVNIVSVLSPGVRPQDNFLFTQIADPDHNHFNFLVSTIAALEIALLVAVAWRARLRSQEPAELWKTVTAWGGAAAVVMLPITFIFWQNLPQLRYVQFPWRWLLCLNVALALLLSMAVRRWLFRALVYAAMLLALVLVWNKLQPPWWDNAADIRELHDNLEEGRGYESVEEYVPSGAKLRGIKKDAPDVIAEGDRNAAVDMDDWSAETKSFSIKVAHPSRLVMHLFSYPAWKVDLNDKWLTTEPHGSAGQLVIPVPAGENKVRIIFSQTNDRRYGVMLSAAALGIVALVALWKRAAGY